MNSTNKFKRRALALSIASLMALSISGMASADENKLQIDIESQSIGQAMRILARNAGVQIIMPNEIGGSFQVAAIKGEYSLGQALEMLVDGSDLEYEFLSDDSVVIKAVAEDDNAGATGDVDEEVVVTGSRLKLKPSQIAGNRIVYDREYLERTGEVTLERALRVLPQNVNGTTEVAGSFINGFKNRSGASTLNLRGLGSQGTLVLVDGKRIGSTGFAGGLSDISSIPMAIVDRVEILLDGASAVYGADAVGGVVNIITRKNYEGMSLNLRYSAPSHISYGEFIGSLGGTFSWDTGRLTATVEQNHHTGLDGDSRNIPLRLQTSNDHIFNRGPVFIGKVRTVGFEPDGTRIRGVIAYQANGQLITLPAYNALTPAEQANYSPVTGVTFPDGFLSADGIQAITNLEATNFPFNIGNRGRGLLPKQERNTLTLNLDQELGRVNMNAVLRYEDRETMNKSGLASINTYIAENNPFNPLQQRFEISAWIPKSNGEYIQTFNESERESVSLDVSFKGDVGENWEWETSVGYSRDEETNTRMNNIDAGKIGAGISSDGVTPTNSFVSFDDDFTLQDCIDQGGTPYPQYGFCYALVAAPAPIDPFTVTADDYLLPDSLGDSINEENRFEAFLRTTSLFELPGGNVSALAGMSWRREVLNTADTSGGDFFSAVGSGAFDASIERDLRAFFMETYLPFFSDDNAIPGINQLGVRLSARYSDYSDVTFKRRGEAIDSCAEQAKLAETLGLEPPPCVSGPGSNKTYGFGLVYSPVDEQLKFNINYSTAFLAPQLNQVILAPTQRVFDSPSTNFLQIPPLADGSCPTVGNWEYNSVVGVCGAQGTEIGGGNVGLLPETSETYTLGAEFAPEFLPGFSGKINWTSIRQHDRITSNNVLYLSSIDDLPSSIVLIGDSFFKQISSVNGGELKQETVDLLLNYEWSTDVGDFSADINVSRANRYELIPEPTVGTVIDAVGIRTRIRGSALSTRVPPVPRYRANAQLHWGYGGLSANLNASTSSKVGRGQTFKYITMPATRVTLGINYDLDSGTLFKSSDWMSGMRASLTVNNLTNDYSTTERHITQDDGSVLIQRFDLNPLFAATRGRVYSVSLRKQF